MILVSFPSTKGRKVPEMKFNSLVSAVAGLLLLVSYPAFAVIDLTEYLRSCGEGNYSITVSGGSEYNGMAKGAFDGDLTSSNGRALMLHGDSANRVSPAIELNINFADSPETGFVVSSFSLYRLTSGSSLYKERTTHTFALQASVDGKSWSTLYQTREKQVWTDVDRRDYEIPVCNRGCFTRYRIKMYPDYSAPTSEEDNYVVGFQELVLYGEVAALKACEGNENGIWDSGTSAYFPTGGESVDIVGEKIANGIVFAADSAKTVAGSRIRLYPSANIFAGSGAVIGNDLSNTGIVMSADHAGWLPRDSTDSKKGRRVRLWKNRRLDQMDFTGAIIKYGKTEQTALPYCIVRERCKTAVQFQARFDSSDGKYVIFSGNVIFEQTGADVCGRIEWIRYKWDDVDLGTDFANADVKPTDGEVYDNEHQSGYGLKDITATGGEEPAPFSVASSSATDSCYSRTECLPADGDNKFTGTPVIYWKNRNVRDIAGIKSVQLLTNEGVRDNATVHCFSNEGETATVQFQALSSQGARVCVKVEFCQSGSDVAARAVYAKYDWDDTSAHDFDGIKGNDKAIRIVRKNDEGKDVAEGYSVRDMEAVFKGEVTLVGRLEVAGSITVCENTVLTLGADSLILENSYTGEGTVRFAAKSGAVQSIAVDGARSMCDATIGGAVEIAIPAGSSLSFESLSFEPEASLSVKVASGALAVRVGAGNVMDSGMLAKIKLNGGSVRQNADGWIVRKPGFVLAIQ